jgi:hypothetical protein
MEIFTRRNRVFRVKHSALAAAADGKSAASGNSVSSYAKGVFAQFLYLPDC